MIRPLCGTARRVLQQLADKSRASRLRDFHNFDSEIVPAKAMDEALGLIEVELLSDVALDARRGGGGERDDRGWPQHGQLLAKHAVVGTEVMAPLRDAMGFVNSDH